MVSTQEELTKSDIIKEDDKVDQNILNKAQSQITSPFEHKTQIPLDYFA